MINGAETFTLLEDKGVIVEFAPLPNDIGKEGYAVQGTNTTIKIMSWGEKNTLPQDREHLILDNNIMLELLSTKRSLLMGQGLKPFKEETDDNGNIKLVRTSIPDDIKAWMENSEFEDQLEEAANQFVIHANIPTGLVLSRDGRTITSMMTYKCRDIRAKERTFGKPVEEYYFGNFNKGKNNKRSPFSTLPTAPKLKYKDKSLKRGEVMLFVSDHLAHDGYYGTPPWWGGKKWISLSNIIPKFHLANLNNGYTIRWHIEIPKNAFLDMNKYHTAIEDGDNSALTACISEAKSERKKFIDTLNSFLSGADNAGRAITTFFEHTEEGKKIEGVKITPLKVDLKDESMLKLFEKSIQASTTSVGVHPTLSSVETQGKLASGSEFRNALEFYIKIKAPLLRRKIMKPWMYVWKFNGWDKQFPEITWAFEDVVLAKLDEEKSGTKTDAAKTIDG